MTSKSKNEYLLEPDERWFLMDRIEELSKLHATWKKNRYEEMEIMGQNSRIKDLENKKKKRRVFLLRNQRRTLQEEIDEKWFIIDAFILDMASKVINVPKTMLIPFPYEICKKPIPQ